MTMQPTTPRGRASRRRAAGSIHLGLAAGACLLSLAACRDPWGMDTPTAVRLGDPDRRHEIGFSSRTETLYVEIPSGAEGLSDNQRVDVYRFIDRYKAESTGPLRVSGPGGMRDHLASGRSLADVHEIARGAGVPMRAIASHRHQSDGRHGATLQLSYDRPVAVAPRCGDWPEDVARDPERIHYTGFGCATQRNLSLTVANSRDLIGPQHEAPRAGERRSQTWSAYVGSSDGGGSGGGTAAPAAAATTK